MGSAAEAITQANRQFEKSFSNGDAAGVAACYTPDGRLFPPGSDVVEGTASIEAFWKGAMGLGIAGVSLNSTEVEAITDGAIETGRYVLTDPDGSEIDDGTYLVVWRQAGGTWRLHRDIWNTNRS